MAWFLFFPLFLPTTFPPTRLVTNWLDTLKYQISFKTVLMNAKNILTPSSPSPCCALSFGITFISRDNSLIKRFLKKRERKNLNLDTEIGWKDVFSPHRWGAVPDSWVLFESQCAASAARVETNQVVIFQSWSIFSPNILSCVFFWLSRGGWRDCITNRASALKKRKTHLTVENSH